jgi:hypothetical protein
MSMHAVALLLEPCITSMLAKRKRAQTRSVPRTAMPHLQSHVRIILQVPQHEKTSKRVKRTIRQQLAKSKIATSEQHNDVQLHHPSLGKGICFGENCSGIDQYVLCSA